MDTFFKRNFSEIVATPPLNGLIRSNSQRDLLDLFFSSKTSEFLLITPSLFGAPTMHKVSSILSPSASLISSGKNFSIFKGATLKYLSLSL